LQQRLNEVIHLLNVIASAPNSPFFNDSVYSRVDGSNPFQSPVAGMPPTLADHLSTKGYVDSSVSSAQSALSAIVSVIQGQVYNLSTQVLLYSTSEWVEHVWSANQKQYLDLPLIRPVTVMDRVVMIGITERIDIAKPTAPIPNPTPVWVYRPVSSRSGALVDNAWLVDQDTVRLLLPNTSATPSGYPAGSGSGDLSAPRSRYYRAVVMEYRTEDPVYDAIDVGDTLAKFVTFPCAGELFQNLTFGYWKPSTPVRISGVQIAMQSASSSDVTIEMLKDGAPSGVTMIIASGQTHGTIPLSFESQDDVFLAAETPIRFKVTSSGSNQGSFLTVNLVYRSDVG
jgi:hypothetical protein